MHNFRSLRRLSSRWYLWIAHLFIYLLVMGFLITGRIPVNRGILAVVALIWFVLWVIHALVLGLNDASELAKYRRRKGDADPDEDDKPKRGYWVVGEDGELVEVTDAEPLRAHH
jgi:hypothetical protein